MKRLDPRLVVALPALVALLVHGRALGGGYVWLDHTHLEEGAALAGSEGVWSLFEKGLAGTGYYRPLTALSLSLDAALWNTPFGFRLVTLAWHALAACMTALAARRLGLSPRAGLLAGLVVAVHPAGTLVADAVAFRSESMIAVCLLGLVSAHLAGRPLLAALALAAGALTKETALVLGPLLVVALEAKAVVAKGRGGEPMRARARLFAAELGALGLACGLRLRYAPDWRATFPPLTLGKALGTRLAAFARSTALLLAPVDGTICDASPVVSLGSGAALVGLVALAFVGYVVYRERNIGPLFALTLLPSLGLVPVMRFWSPHYLYVPLAFGAMLVADALDRRERLLVPVAVSAGVAWSFLSFVQGARYLNDAALFRPEVERRPTCREAQFFLGEVARVAQDWDGAARRYEAALRENARVLAYVDRGAALQNLGAARFAQGRFAEAARAWTRALELSRDPVQQRRLRSNLGAAALRAGNPSDTVRWLADDVSAPSPLPESLLLMTAALRQLGHEPEALAPARRSRDAKSP